MANRQVKADLILRAQDRTGRAFKSLNKRLAGVQNRAKRFNRDNGKIARTAVAVGRGVALTATAATAVGIAGYKNFAEAERALTRIGNDLNASREQMTALGQDAREFAKLYALPYEAIVGTIAEMAKSGLEIDDIRASLEKLVKSQQAIDASGEAIARSYDAARKSLNLATEDAEKFFGVIATGSAIGKFEASDLAVYLPDLASIAGNLGFQGIEGTERIVALLETARDYTGSSEKAANGFRDFFEKISSPAVQRNFAKFGIDLEKELGKALENGERIEVVMSRLINKATGGDAKKLGHLFGEVDSRNMARVLMLELQVVLERLEEIRAKSGKVLDENLDRVLGDQQAKIDRVNESIDQIAGNVGAAVAPAIGNVLDAANANLERDMAYRRGLEARGMGFIEREWELLKNVFDEDEKNRIAAEAGYRFPKIEGGSRQSGTKTVEGTEFKMPIEVPVPLRAPVGGPATSGGLGPKTPGGPASAVPTPRGIYDARSKEIESLNQTIESPVFVEDRQKRILEEDLAFAQTKKGLNHIAPHLSDDEARLQGGMTRGVETELQLDTNMAEQDLGQFSTLAEKPHKAVLDLDTGPAMAKLGTVEARINALSKRANNAGPGPGSGAGAGKKRDLGRTMPDVQ